MSTVSKMNNASTELAAKEIQAKQDARSMADNYLQREEQLDKTELLGKYISRQKGSVEAVLKSAFQSQLDEVKKGMNLLNISLEEVMDIGKNLESAKVDSQEVNNLKIALKSIRDECTRHSQLTTACANISHISSVPSSLKKCEEYLKEGKLLLAHKSISDMEQSRDDVMYELFKQSNPSPTDKLMVMQYFEGLDELVKELDKQLSLTLQRIIVSMRLAPAMVVTVMRIIEREENLDNVIDKKYGQMKAIGRPKKWKERAFKIMEQAVLGKVEGNLMEDRTVNKMWLVRHLELLRQAVFEDFKVITTLCDQCFPPHYNMVSWYINMYHKSISLHLSDIMEQGLQGNEVLSLLNWSNEYLTDELMGYPDFKIDLNTLTPLLSAEAVRELNNQHLVNLRAEMKEWMHNSIKSDSKDWYKEQPPYTDANGFYSTSLPVDLIKMIEEPIEVAKTISKSLEAPLVNMCFEEMHFFLSSYKAELTNLQSIHLANRSKLKYYLQYVIANTNNCQALADFMLFLNNKHTNALNPEKVKILSDKFASLGFFLCEFLLKEVFVDLDPHIKELLTRKWFTSEEAVDTVCLTFEDYCQDFGFLKDNFFYEVLSKARLRLAKNYYQAILSKKIMFKSYEERALAADKVVKETDQLRILFDRLLKSSKPYVGAPYSGFQGLAELIKLRDSSMLTLEVSGFASKFPDIRSEMLVNVLMMRGDMSTSEAKKVVLDSLGENHDFMRNKVQKTIFSSLE